MTARLNNSRDGKQVEVSQKIKIMTYGPITSRQTEGEKMQAVIDFIFLGSKITADSDCSHEMACSLELKMLVPWEKSYDKPRQQRIHFVNKGLYNQS